MEILHSKEPPLLSRRKKVKKRPARRIADRVKIKRPLGKGNNQYGTFDNFLVTHKYLLELGFRKLTGHTSRSYAIAARYGFVVVTLKEGTRIHIRGISDKKSIEPGKFIGNCVDETEFLDRVEFLSLL